MSAVSRRRWLQISLRSAVALVLAVNVALAAYFHWTWEVRIGDWSKTTAKISITEERERLLLGAEFDLGRFVHGAASYNWWNDSSASRTPSTRQFRWCNSVPQTTWSRQTSRVRHSWEHGRESHGLTTLYYEDGSVCGTEMWQAGKLHGPYRRYYPDGKRLTEGVYVHGERHGLWTNRSHDGLIVGKAEFDKGRPIGIWEQHYRPLGQRQESDRLSTLIAIDLAGATPFALDATWTFAANGIEVVLDRREVSKDDTAPSALRFQQHYEGDWVRHGRQTIHDDHGRLRFEADWIHGAPHGRWASYDAGGTCLLAAQFDEGGLRYVNDELCSSSVGSQFAALSADLAAELSLNGESLPWVEIIDRCLPKRNPNFRRAALEEKWKFQKRVHLVWDDPLVYPSLGIFAKVLGLGLTTHGDTQLLEPVAATDDPDVNDAIRELVREFPDPAAYPDPFASPNE